MLTIHRERPCHESNYRKGRKQAVKYLVIHYVGALGGAADNAKYYGSTPGIGASAHYFVGHGPAPELWASVAEGDTAWHCGANKYVHPDCRNDNAIGVELCCHKDATGVWYFDAETVDAAIELCRDIVSRYGITPDRVLRHYDVTGKVCPAPFVNDPAAWEAFKGRVFADASAPDSGDSPPVGWGPTVGTVPLSDGPLSISVADWAKTAWDKAKTKKGRDGKTVMDGTRPWDSITRQEVAVILDRLGLLEGGK